MAHNTSKFIVEGTKFSGLNIINRSPVGDSRGSFERIFCEDELFQLGIKHEISQINISENTRKGTLRGMHFQTQHAADSKIISCIRGSVWDVVVDLRRNSPTFLETFSMEINEFNHQSIHVPRGFAHGFQTLTDNSTLLYFHNAPHKSNAQRFLNPLDPRLEIDWPTKVTEISDLDRNSPRLSELREDDFFE